MKEWQDVAGMSSLGFKEQKFFLDTLITFTDHEAQRQRTVTNSIIRKPN